MPESEPKPKLIELVGPGAGQGWKAVLKNGKPAVVHEIPVPPAEATAAVPRLQRLFEHRHPALSPVLAWGTDQNGVWVAVEPNEGTPLSSILARGPLTPPAAAALGAAVLSGVAALHEAGIALGGFGAQAVRVTSNGDVRLAGHPAAAVRGAPSQSDLRADVRSCGMAVCAAFGVDPAGAPAPANIPPGLVVTMRSMASGAMGPSADRAQGALREMAAALLAPDRQMTAQSELATRAGGREVPAITPFLPEGTVSPTPHQTVTSVPVPAPVVPTPPPTPAPQTTPAEPAAPAPEPPPAIPSWSTNPPAPAAPAETPPGPPTWAVTSPPAPAPAEASPASAFATNPPAPAPASAPPAPERPPAQPTWTPMTQAAWTPGTVVPSEPLGTGEAIPALDLQVREPEPARAPAAEPDFLAVTRASGAIPAPTRPAPPPSPPVARVQICTPTSPCNIPGDSPESGTACDLSTCRLEVAVYFSTSQKSVPVSYTLKFFNRCTGQTTDLPGAKSTTPASGYIVSVPTEHLTVRVPSGVKSGALVAVSQTPGVAASAPLLLGADSC